MLIEFTLSAELDAEVIRKKEKEIIRKTLSDLEEVIGKSKLAFDDSAWEEV